MNGAPYRRHGAVWPRDLPAQPRATRTEPAGSHDGRRKTVRIEAGDELAPRLSDLLGTTP